MGILQKQWESVPEPFSGLEISLVPAAIESLMHSVSCQVDLGGNAAPKVFGGTAASDNRLPIYAIVNDHLIIQSVGVE